MKIRHTHAHGHTLSEHEKICTKFQFEQNIHISLKSPLHFVSFIKKHTRKLRVSSKIADKRHRMATKLNQFSNFFGVLTMGLLIL